MEFIAALCGSTESLKRGLGLLADERSITKLKVQVQRKDPTECQRLESDRGGLHVLLVGCPKTSG